MAWTDLPADEHTDWSNVGFLNQFRDALFERARVVNQQSAFNSTYQGAVITPGTDVQHYLRFQRWQQFIEQILAPRFANPQKINYDIPTLLVFSWTPAELRAAAGLHPQGFTRRFPREINSTGDTGAAGQTARHRQNAQIYQHDGTAWLLAEDQLLSPDVITAFGFMQPGDYIGPWLFNELQAGINVLTHVHEAPAWQSVFSSRGYSGDWRSSNYSSVSEGVEDVKARAEANWPNVQSVQDDLGTAFPPSFTNVPHAVSWWGAANFYNAGLHRRSMRPARPGIAGFLPYTAQVRILPQAANFGIWGGSGAVHPANHNEPFTLDTWHLIFDGPVTTSTIMPQVGTVPASVKPVWWTTNPAGSMHQHGWRMTFVSAILEYEFTHRATP